MVEYDPRAITYNQLLDAFWRSHDPTQGNRQGVDVGSQYRSAIFTYSAAQSSAASNSRDALRKSGKFQREITTQILPAGHFWLAEPYHQQYYEKHGLAGCRIR